MWFVAKPEISSHIIVLAAFVTDIFSIGRWAKPLSTDVKSAAVKILGPTLPATFIKGARSVLGGDTLDERSADCVWHLLVVSVRIVVPSDTISIPVAFFCAVSGSEFLRF